MKKIAIALAVLLLLAIGVVAYAVINVNSLIDDFKPRVESAASDAVGAPVTLGTITVGLFPPISLRVESVAVSGEEEEGLTLRDVSMRAKLLPILFGNLSIAAVVVEEPDVTLLMDEDGIRVAGLPQSEESEEEAPDSGESSALPDFALSALEIRNGSVLFRDLTTDTEYPVRELDTKMTLLSANNRITLDRLEASGAVLENIGFSADGDRVIVDMDTGAVEIDTLVARLLGNRLDIAGTLDAADPEKRVMVTAKAIKLDTLGPVYDEFAPDVNDMQVTGDVACDLAVSYPDKKTMTISGALTPSNVAAVVSGIEVKEAGGVIDIETDLTRYTAASDEIALQVMDSPLKAAFEAEMEGENLKVKTARIDGFSGRVDAAADVVLAETVSFGSTFSGEEVAIGEVLAALVPDSQFDITGTVSEFNGAVAGQVTDDLTQTLKGDVTVAMNDGRIHDLNLAAMVLKSVTDLPVIPGSLYNLVPQNMISEFERDYTVINTLTGKFNVADGAMSTDNLLLVSNRFDLAGKGSVGFDYKTDLETRIIFGQELSQRLVGNVQEASLLLNEKKRLGFPVAIRGTLPKVTVYPDVKNLAKEGAKKIVQQEVDKLKQEADKAVKKELEEALGKDAEKVAPGAEKLLDEATDTLRRFLPGQRKKKEEPEEESTP